MAKSQKEGRYLKEIDRHIDQFIGRNQHVLREIVSPTVHIDVHVVEPSPELPYLTLISSGMSDLDMNPPSGAVPPEDYRLAEIIAFLPSNWKLPEGGGTTEDDPPGWFPVRWIKHYARMVHEENTAISWTVTTQNGNPPSPIGENTAMSGFLFAPALQLGPNGIFIPTDDGRTIRLLNLVPILPDEIDFAAKLGGEALCDKLDRAENFVFDPNRQSCLKRKKLFGLF